MKAYRKARGISRLENGFTLRVAREIRKTKTEDGERR